MVTDSGVIVNTVTNDNMTYSGGLISSLTGSIDESITSSSVNYSSTTRINTSFQAGSGKIISYVQKATTSGSP